MQSAHHRGHPIVEETKGRLKIVEYLKDVYGEYTWKVEDVSISRRTESRVEIGYPSDFASWCIIDCSKNKVGNWR